MFLFTINFFTTGLGNKTMHALQDLWGEEQGDGMDCVDCEDSIAAEPLPANISNEEMIVYAL
jgi:hypothetical protein